MSAHVLLVLPATQLLLQAVHLALFALQVPTQLAVEVHAWLYPVLSFAVQALT